MEKLMIASRSLVVATIVFFYAGLAAGRTISTPALANNPGSPSVGDNDTFICTVVNTRPTPVTNVTFGLIRADGTTIVSAGPLTLEPGDPRVLIWESAEELVYCRVEGKVSKKSTLVSLCNSDSASEACDQAVVQAP